MKVSELAKELNTTSVEILKTLKTLMLKSKDENQELNVAVESVVRSEFANPRKIAAKKEEKEKTPKPKKEEAKAEEKSVQTEQMVVKKKAVKKKTATKEKKENSKEENKEEKKAKQPKTLKKTDELKLKKSLMVEEADKEAKVKEEGKDKGQGEVKERVNAKAQAEKSKDKEKAPAAKKRRVSRQPVITLKPLARKKKKSSKDDSRSADFSQNPEQILTMSSEGSMSIANDEIKGSLQSEEGASVPLPQVQIPPKIDTYDDLEIKVPITVKELSIKIQQKPSVVLAKLMGMGIMTNINQSLDADIVGLLTQQFGINLVKIKTQEEHLIEFHKQQEEEEGTLQLRAPVVTFMGHVDHGKTTLLDKIRKSKVADREHGGITQHMGAYSVEIQRGRITFLDTPGHEAFTSMRARGAHITDLVVLVVASDEGVMPQTIEAVDHARAADVPIVVALTKIDKQNSDPDKVKKQLAAHNLASEDWGGKTVVVGVSGVTGEGVNELLELILLEAELLELKANHEKKASGIIVEAHLSQGKGAVSTVIVQSGKLMEGDIIVVGSHYGRIKAMFNDLHQPIKEAGPSMPAEVLGLSKVPDAGEMFYVVDDEKQAREISLRRSEQLKKAKLQSKQKITLEGLYAQLQDGAVKELNVIIKSDVQGSLEALKDSLEKIPSDKVKVNFIHLGVGDINASDVVLAVASKAIIIAFHVGVSTNAKAELKKEPVDIREYRIIYDAVDDVKNALEGLLEEKIKKNFLAKVEIREVFKLSKHGIVAGCYVEKGKVHRKDHVDIIRNGEVVFSGVISGLKRFKDDVKEVAEGTECGISVEGYDKYQSGDIIEAFAIERIAQKL